MLELGKSSCKGLCLSLEELASSAWALGLCSACARLGAWEEGLELLQQSRKQKKPSLGAWLRLSSLEGKREEGLQALGLAQVQFGKELGLGLRASIVWSEACFPCKPSFLHTKSLQEELQA